jgi:tetratricopeptide (TPR) repeat protein
MSDGGAGAAIGGRVMTQRVDVSCLVLAAWLCVAPGPWGLGSGEAAQSTPPPASAPRQLVIPFENATGEPRTYWLGEGSAVLLTDDLIALGVPAIRREDRLRAFERLRVPPVAALSHATVIRLAQVVGAAQVVVGAFELQGGDLVVRARTIRLDTGRISPELVERGPLADLLNIYARIALRAAASASSIPVEQLTRGYPPLPAFEQYIKGLLAEAPAAQIVFLTQALRVFPAFERARVALWDVHTAQGNHQQALDAVRQVPGDVPLARQARFLGAVSMLHLGQHQAAFSAFSELNRTTRDPALLNNLGVVQLQRPSTSLTAGQSTSFGTGGRAVSYFGEAVALDGSDADLFFNLGYAFWLDRDMPGAIHWLREAVRRNPADDEAHHVLGVALQASGSAAEAAREKELARQLSATWADWEVKQPGANTAPRGLERLKVEIDVPESLRVDAAVVAAEQRDQREIAMFHLERAGRLLEAGLDAEAIAELRRTIFLVPYESKAHVMLGRIYIRTGRTQDAIDALTIAVWSDPANAEAKALLDTLK